MRKSLVITSQSCRYDAEDPRRDCEAVEENGFLFAAQPPVAYGLEVGMSGMLFCSLSRGRTMTVRVLAVVRLCLFDRCHDGESG